MTNWLDFTEKWSHSGGNERANKDIFLSELAIALGVPGPNIKTGDPARDLYVFEYDVPTLHEGGKVTTCKADLFKHGCFILEAKQGSNPGDKKTGFARRNTTAWEMGMRDAYGQALGYASSMDDPPPFIVVSDIGYCFDLYASFDGGTPRPFPNALLKRIFVSDLATNEKYVDTLRKVWTDPFALDPSRHAAKVTREVAESLAKLAMSLEKQGHNPEFVAKFLMRCLFTMFAEDVGLLPARTFTDLIKNQWLHHPHTFAAPGGVSALWQAMDAGTTWPLVGKLLRFNGGLFADSSAIDLKRGDLQLLLDAAERNWADVEPAIFGTLLERALLPKERHMLGAHFTPRAYVERLVRPTIEEPLRAEWENVQAEVRQIVLAAGPEPARPALTEEQVLALGRETKARQAAWKKYQDEVKAREAKLGEAREALLSFLRKLASTRVLDPACGSGNFLYVALDFFKKLEGEVLDALKSVGVTQEMLAAREMRVTPGQFLGIEVKPWAKEIAELVLWIGYIQWHYRTHGRAMAPPEPVLIDYKNIECRDAVLDWDRVDTVLDEHDKPVTRWDGVTTKRSPVTGEMVPDESATVELKRYVNPRKAEWPRADYVVGNPPFIGNKRMRLTLGDGYVEALRAAHADVPESADLVMYWWNHAATLLERKQLRRFGLITTNSIIQSFNRRVIAGHSAHASIAFAIPDHPWVDSHGDAQVRIAMTVAIEGQCVGRLQEVTFEAERSNGERQVELSTRTGALNADLTIGANLSNLVKLMASRGLSCPGVQLSGQGFIVSPEQAMEFTDETRSALLRQYLTGRDLSQVARTQFVFDTFGLDEATLQRRFPDAYQWLLDRVKPERTHNPRASYARNWWLHSEPRSKFRAALAGLDRFVGTSRTARHRLFQFLSGESLPETKVLIVALSDGFHLGVLSSRVHVTFANATGGWLGVGNDSTYNHSACFDTYPFPTCTDLQAARIRDLGEALDAHRKSRQAAHPTVTITGMYNVLEKLRAGEALTERDKDIHEAGLVSVLKKIHDDLDAAVFDAYGWPSDLTDEQVLERLVALNAERAEEEARNPPLIRWLRPEYQNPAGATSAAQTTNEAGEDGETAATITTEAKPWPKKLAERILVVRERAVAFGRLASVDDVAAGFKRAPRKDVEDLLESLAAVGVLASLNVDGGRRWRPVAWAA